MRKNKFLLIIVLLFSVCFLFACENGGSGNGGNTPDNPPEPEIDWDSKEVFDITAVNETFYATYEYDEFELSMLKINVLYTDGTSRVIPVDESMLSDKDLNKLKSTGQPRITIEYGGCEIQMKVKLTDSSKLDEDLNIDGLYACVIKAIRDKDNNVINFYIELNEEYAVCAYSFAFSFDQSIMQLSNPVMNSELTGIGDVLLQDNKIIFAYTENVTAMEEVPAEEEQEEQIQNEILLFSVHYEGDYRNSKLALDENYNSVVYVADFETYETSPVSNVLYHVSVK